MSAKKRERVECFFIQPTASFEVAPQREDYDSDEQHNLACAKYDVEWRATYFHDGRCENRDCPQCFPAAEAWRR